jgi:hypothetical protein
MPESAMRLKPHGGHSYPHASLDICPIMPPFLQPYRGQMPMRSSRRQIADCGWALAAGKSVHGFLILGSQGIPGCNLFSHETQSQFSMVFCFGLPIF